MRTELVDLAWAGESCSDASVECAFTPRAPATETIKPFLRWAGGKSRLIGRILPYVPDGFETYHEPFLGSGAVYFAVRGRAAGGCRLSDLNEELINIWSLVQTQPEQLAIAIGRYQGRNSEEDYYTVRGSAPKGRLERAARFFYLNQTAWNGLWRVNRWGVFNVPWGARPFRGISGGELAAVARALGDARIENTDFRTALTRAQAGDFVYLDPPYLPVSDTSKFSGYTGKRFRRADLAELAEATVELDRRGVHWIMSNRDSAEVRDLFSHGAIVRFTTRRSVAAQNRRDIQPKDSPEVIVVGGSRP